MFRRELAEKFNISLKFNWLLSGMVSQKFQKGDSFVTIHNFNDVEVIEVNKDAVSAQLSTVMISPPEKKVYTIPYNQELAEECYTTFNEKYYLNSIISSFKNIVERQVIDFLRNNLTLVKGKEGYFYKTNGLKYGSVEDIQFMKEKITIVCNDSANFEKLSNNFKYNRRVDVIFNDVSALKTAFGFHIPEHFVFKKHSVIFITKEISENDFEIKNGYIFFTNYMKTVCLK